MTATNSISDSTSTGTAGAPRAHVGHPTGRRSHPVLRDTVVSGVAAAAAAAAFAAVAHAAGVPFEIDGEQIPVGGFAMLTLIGAVIGGILLLVTNRVATHARRRFLQTTVVLTALSCIPSVMAPPDAASKLALVAAHVLAAAVIVPVLARDARR